MHSGILLLILWLKHWKSLYPGMKFGIGPAIENGFYYDVDPGDDKVITEADLLTIENKMKELAAKNLTIHRRDISKKDALDFFTKKGDEYKTELISELTGRYNYTLYTGQFHRSLPWTSPPFNRTNESNKASQCCRCILERK